MRKIFAIGETVLDVIFEKNKPVAAKAGGSMLNTSVSLGRMEQPIYFISEYGMDAAGRIIDKFLKDNNVSDKFIYRYTEGKTALSLAFLDENSDADYSFYKIYPEKRLSMNLPDIQQDDIFLFGSFYSLTPVVRDTIIRFVEIAKSKKAIVIYDPNFRKSHKDDLPKLRTFIEKNISYADIIRGSNEDFSCIFGLETADDAYKQIMPHCKNLVYTANKAGVFLVSPSLSQHYDVNAIEPVSTIGAGDTFNAGIIYGLMTNNIRHKDIQHINQTQWRDIIQTAIQFSTEVCMSYENYLPVEYVKQFI